MAILKERDLNVEIKYTGWAYGWVEYAFRFFYGSMPLFNPEIRDKDFFFANEYLECSLLPVLEKALETDQKQRWYPTEPDIQVDINPWLKEGWKDYERYLENKIILYVSEEHKERLKKIDENRQLAGGKLPDDSFELIFRVDDAQLKQLPESQGGYSGDGPALTIIVSRDKLKKFVADLKQEYNDLELKYRKEINRK